MVLIGRRSFIFLGAVVILGTTALGVYGYRSFADSGPAVFTGQRFLYVAFLFVVLEILLFMRVLLRSRNVGRELDKLIEITRYRGLPNARNLKRLGPIGDQISRLFDQLNSLSERKSLKISSLSELSAFLMNNVSVPAIVATVDGKVVYASRAFLERTKRPRNEIIDGQVDDLAPGIRFTEVTAELDRVHSSLQGKSKRTMLTFYPIRNGADQLSYVVCVLQGNAGLVEQAARVLSEESTRRAAGNRVRRLLDFGRNTAARFSQREKNR
jgi:PAS domain-containing protein